MSITGMKLWIYYFTWFIRYFVVYLVIHLIVSAIMLGAFKQVPYYIPLVIFILFDILLIIQSFFIQIFVTRAKIGIVVALLFFVLQYAINFIIANN
jgi:ATP-binding cassette subfamily A (ABC1) protein 3